jgi:hypothetical protein
METLPTDIINIILEFQGYHICRNGKYIPRISKDDPRRVALLKIPKYYIIDNDRFIMNVSIRKPLDRGELFIIIQRVIMTNTIIWIMSISKWSYSNCYNFKDKIQFVLQ